jgi:hypothetical protein
MSMIGENCLPPRMMIVEFAQPDFCETIVSMCKRRVRYCMAYDKLKAFCRITFILAIKALT